MQNFSTNKTVSKKEQAKSTTTKKKKKKKNGEQSYGDKLKQALQNEKLKGDKFQFLMQDEKLMVFFDGSTKGVGRAGFSVEGGDMIDSKKDVPVDGQNRKSYIANHRQSTYQNQWSRELNAITSLKQ